METPALTIISSMMTLSPQIPAKSPSPPAALLPYTFGPHTHAAAINVFQTQDVYPELIPSPVLPRLALLGITSAKPYQRKSPHLHCLHRHESVSREIVSWQYTAPTQRALHQLLQQCQGDTQCRRSRCVCQQALGMIARSLPITTHVKCVLLGAPSSMVSMLSAKRRIQHGVSVTVLR